MKTLKYVNSFYNEKKSHIKLEVEHLNLEEIIFMDEGKIPFNPKKEKGIFNSVNLFLATLNTDDQKKLALHLSELNKGCLKLNVNEMAKKINQNEIDLDLFSKIIEFVRVTPLAEKHTLTVGIFQKKEDVEDMLALILMSQIYTPIFRILNWKDNMRPSVMLSETVKILHDILDAKYKHIISHFLNFITIRIKHNLSLVEFPITLKEEEVLFLKEYIMNNFLCKDFADLELTSDTDLDYFIIVRCMAYLRVHAIKAQTKANSVRRKAARKSK